MDNYPPGMENHPDAPYNQDVEKDHDLTIYLVKQGINPDDLRVDLDDRIYVSVEGVDEFGSEYFKEIPLPEEYQTGDNIEYVRTGRWSNDEVDEYE